MKKFVNRPEDAVEEMLDGLVTLHPGLARLAGHKVIIRADADETRNRQVAILSGGGSGHEPAHAGYVGAGMLSAAVAGEVFTSPSSDSVYAAIKAVTGQPGVLLVVKNYTGDRLNFGLAAEMARAEGIPVELVVVDDDVALLGAANATGARGLAGTVFIHKLVGAAAHEGKSLAEIAAMGREAVKALATMGVSFSAGTAPAVGKPSFELAENEMELGLGIHGEPGAQRTTIQAVDPLTETLLQEILQRKRFSLQKRVAVMINNLGATTEMELAITARHATRFLAKNGLTVERIFAGTFLSSLDMAGISISVLGLDDQRLHWLDAETAAPAWPNAATKQRPGELPVAMAGDAKTIAPSHKASQSAKARIVRQAIDAACQALIDNEPELTELDRITGDGDLGVSMQRAAKAVRAALDSYPLENIPGTVKALGHTLRKELGGSSGPLYGILFLRCGSVLETADWPAAILEGCQAMSELGGAKLGDRTMLDSLIPFAEEWRKAGIRKALAAADCGVEKSAQMKPRSGRSSYLGDRVLGHSDPGARAVAIWLRAIIQVVEG